MELTKIEGTTKIADYPVIQSANMTKIEEFATAVDNTVIAHSAELAKKADGIECETETAEINVVNDCSNLPLRKLVVEGRSEQKQYSGKNLWDGMKGMSNSKASLTREINSISGLSTDLRVKSNGSATYASVQRRIDQDLKTGVQYTVSFDVEIITKGNIRVSRRKSSSTLITSVACSADGHYKLTFTKSADDYYLTFMVTYSTADEGEAIFRNIQIEEGNADTDYEPYCGSYYDSENDVNVIMPSPNPDYPQPIESVGDSGELVEYVDNALENPTVTQQASIPLTEPLRSSADGTLKDILKINADGSGNIARYIGEKTANNIKGTWQIINSSKIFYIRVTDSAAIPLTEHILTSCDKYKSDFVGNSDFKNLCFKLSFVSGQESGYAYFRDTRFSTTEEWGNYIKENIITFTYVLKDPIIEQLTPAQTQAFLALHSNKLTTVAYNSDNAKQSITYVADTKQYIDNKFDEIKNAIISLGGNI